MGFKGVKADIGEIIMLNKTSVNSWTGIKKRYSWD